MKKKIEADVLEVLNRSKIEKNLLILPEQLDRKLYDRTNKVITNHGGKWNKSAKAHVFPGDAREALGIALETGETENQQQAKQAFFTPAALAQEMVARACIQTGDCVLEPSAGEGSILMELDDRCKKIEAIELDPGHCKKLKAMFPVTELARHKVWVREGDFLKQNLFQVYAPGFDVVLMNPPFTKNQDTKHILHAWTFLRPGGRLVAIASAGVKFRTSKADIELRDLIETHGELEDLPEGTFKESGTNVNTVIIKLTRPEDRHEF